MTTNNFIKALQFTLKWEGGYINDPSDPGGETKWGISKRAHPDVDIKNLQEAGAAEIYWKEYWCPTKCDTLGLPMAVCVFDTAVNCGVWRAERWLKKSTTPKELLAERINHYGRLVANNSDFKKFYKGWINRVVDLRKYVEILTEETTP